ncbi:PaaI family thioesterase, partial [Dietzia lutea]
FQGPPGCVHGGVVAMLFDEMLGLANAAAEHIGMTVDLQVTYSAPTPLDTPLRFEARQERVDGRKLWCAGTLHAGDTLCASVRGMFVTPRWMLDGDQSKPIEG